MSKEGIKEAAIAPIRTVRVTYSPPVTDPKVVRFQGTSFGQLHERLLAAKVPGVDGKSYIELLVPGEGFVCPLPGEALPNFSEITISVQGKLTSVSHRRHILQGPQHTWGDLSR